MKAFVHGLFCRNWNVVQRWALQNADWVESIFWHVATTISLPVIGCMGVMVELKYWHQIWIVLAIVVYAAVVWNCLVFWNRLTDRVPFITNPRSRGDGILMRLVAWMVPAATVGDAQRFYRQLVTDVNFACQTWFCYTALPTALVLAWQPWKMWIRLIMVVFTVVSWYFVLLLTKPMAALTLQMYARLACHGVSTRVQAVQMNVLAAWNGLSMRMQALGMRVWAAWNGLVMRVQDLRVRIRAWL